MNESVKKIGVIGAGVMGHGIAMAFATNGYSVILIDVSEKLLNKAMEQIADGRYGLQRLVEKGKISGEEKERTLSRIKPTLDFSDLYSADLIIEAVPENISIKGDILSRAGKMSKKEAIIASNTSGIMISELSKYVSVPERFLGMHWFNPPQIMKLIEIVRGPETSPGTVKTIEDLSRSISKVPVVVNDSPGFFTTRFINAWLVEAYRQFELGIAGIKEIDTMSKLAFGFPMGPFELSDLIGLDTIMHISDYMYQETKNPAYAAPTVLKKLVHSGYVGKKPGSKGGWYDYYFPSEA